MDTLLWCFQNPLLVAETWIGLVLSSYFVVFWVCYCYQNKVQPVLAIVGFTIQQIITILAACYMTTYYVVHHKYYIEWIRIENDYYVRRSQNDDEKLLLCKKQNALWNRQYL